MSEIIVNSKNIGNRNLTVWLENTGAEGDKSHLCEASSLSKKSLKCVYDFNHLCIADIDSLAPVQKRCITCSIISSLDRQLIKLQMQGESINV